MFPTQRPVEAKAIETIEISRLDEMKMISDHPDRITSTLSMADGENTHHARLFDSMSVRFDSTA
jgi:hypothetical protein